MQTLEIHLATGFQNLFMDHAGFPAGLKEQIYRWLNINAADERKAGETDAQFYYKARKKAMGAYKPELWALPEEAKTALFAAMEEQFQFFFDKLNVTETRDLIDRTVNPVEVHKPMPKSARGLGDDLGLAD